MILLHKKPCERNVGISCQTSTALDILRVFAAHMVLVGHALSVCGLTFLSKQAHFPYIQNIGVVQLLLISGYLMGYKIKVTYHYGELNTENCGQVYKEFILKKAGRIYAGLLPALVLVWIIDTIVIIQAPVAYCFYPNFTFSNFLAALTMTQRIPVFGDIQCFGSSVQMWTLSIEWWLIILCGYLAFYIIPLRKAGHLRVIHLLILLLMGYPVVQYLYFGNVPVSPHHLVCWYGGFLFPG